MGDELVIAHPKSILPSYEAAAVAAGPAVYLLALTLFGRRLTGSWYVSKLLGVLACAVAGIVGLFVPALMLAGLLIVVLVVVILVDYSLFSEHITDAETSPERLGT